MNPYFLAAVAAFNRQDFYVCHELLEDFLWRPAAPGPEKQALQGWIQLAVGCLHHQRGNRTGAKNLLASGLQKLCPTDSGWAWMVPVSDNLQQLLAAILATSAQLPMPPWQYPTIQPTGLPPKYCVFTGNRADYGLLVPVLREICQRHGPDALCLMVGGDHLRAQHRAEVLADPWRVSVTLALPASEDMPLSPPTDDTGARWACDLTASLLQQLAQLWQWPMARPQVLILLGDRVETYGVALAAFYHGIPIAHLGGGDVTEGGCLDDVLRNQLSGLARWHFVSNTASRNCLVACGVPVEDITVCGATVLDNILATPRIEKAALCDGVGFTPQRPIALFTQHPIPADGPATVTAMAQSLAALYALGQDVGLQTLATYPNRDGFPEAIEALIQDSTARHAPHIHWVENLGRQGYLSWLAACDVVVGNSSSGLIETPFFNKPSVTIGKRQDGRVRAANVCRVDTGYEAVYAGVRATLEAGPFTVLENPFGTRPAAPVILDILAPFVENQETVL